MSPLEVYLQRLYDEVKKEKLNLYGTCRSDYIFCSHVLHLFKKTKNGRIWEKYYSTLQKGVSFQKDFFLIFFIFDFILLNFSLKRKSINVKGRIFHSPTTLQRLFRFFRILILPPKLFRTLCRFNVSPYMKFRISNTQSNSFSGDGI